MKSRIFQASILVFVFVVFGSADNRVNADIVFELTDSVPAFGDGLNDGDALTVGGITMTFSNVAVSNGTSFGDVESAGILMSSTTDVGLTDVLGFDFSFSENVQINTYNIGLREDVPLGSFFSINGSNGTSGNNTIPDGTLLVEQTLSFDPGTIAVVEAGQVYSFTHNLTSTGDPLFNFKGFAVSAVPEPNSACLISVGILAFAYRRKRCV